MLGLLHRDSLRNLSSARVLLIAAALILSQQVEAQQTIRRSSPNKSVRSVREATRTAQRNQPEESSRTQAYESPQNAVDGLNRAGQGDELPEEKLPESPVEGMPKEYRIPLRAPNLENIRMKAEDGLISLVARDGSLADIVTLFAETQGLNVVTADPLDVPVSITLERVTLDDALDAILSVAGYTWTINKNIILITNLANGGAVAPQTQGLRLQVFTLDYALARDVNTAVTGLLSPVGTAYIISSSDAESRQSREMIAVQDLPNHIERITEYIAEVDMPPRQVLIEVHILQVDLDATNRHGVNWDQLFHRNGSVLIEMHGTGLATATPAQGFTFRVSDGNLTALIEMIRTTTDAKTLASPRILAINGQLSRIQVGEQLGFRVTTTTETSTTQSVDFLDVGVVLEVTPHISRDGRIMLSVRPEVSSGRVNPDTGLPEEKTTELDTDVMLCDNEGVVIGGLLQEADTDARQQLPWIGDLHLIGPLFRRKEATKSRREIIMAIVPRLVPYQPQYNQFASEKFVQAQTPLLEGPLLRVPRPWEPRHPEKHLHHRHPMESAGGFVPPEQWNEPRDAPSGTRPPDSFSRLSQLPSDATSEPPQTRASRICRLPATSGMIGNSDSIGLGRLPPVE